MDNYTLVQFTVDLLVAFTLANILMFSFGGMTIVERRLLARFGLRIGPNRTGPYGLLQIVADGVKMFFKEELIPDHVNRLVYVIAPAIALIPALISFAVVPLMSGPYTIPLPVPIFEVSEIVIKPFIADVNVAVLYLLAIGSLGTYGVVLGGWASNNKYSLLGGLRTSAQMLSYELPMGVALASIILVAGSMRMQDIVIWQEGPFGFGFGWFIFFQPIAFLIFFISGLAEAGRSPFDLPETENELIGGFVTEYGGMKFGLFFAAEYVHMIVFSFLTATLFLGGWQGPFAQQIPILGLIYLLLKVAFTIFVIIWVRASIPRVRFDHLMQFCWKFLLPLAIANLFVTAIAVALWRTFVTGAW